MAHPYDVGTKAWQPDATEGWVASEVTEKKVKGDKVLLVFMLENGEVWQLESMKGEDTDADCGRPKL
jgi:myosin-5